MPPSACLNILQRMARPQHTGTQSLEDWSAAISASRDANAGDYTLESGRARVEGDTCNGLQLAERGWQGSGERIGARACNEQGYGDEQLREGVFDAAGADVEAVL